MGRPKSNWMRVPHLQRNPGTPPPKKRGCPTFAASLFLRLRWDTNIYSFLSRHNLAEVGDAGKAAQHFVDEPKMRATHLGIGIENHHLVEEGVDDRA